MHTLDVLTGRVKYLLTKHAEVFRCHYEIHSHQNMSSHSIMQRATAWLDGASQSLGKINTHYLGFNILLCLHDTQVYLCLKCELSHLQIIFNCFHINFVLFSSWLKYEEFRWKMIQGVKRWKIERSQHEWEPIILGSSSFIDYMRR